MATFRVPMPIFRQHQPFGSYELRYYPTGFRWNLSVTIYHGPEPLTTYKLETEHASYDYFETNEEFEAQRDAYIAEHECDESAIPISWIEARMWPARAAMEHVAMPAFLNTCIKDAKRRFDALQLIVSLDHSVMP